MSVDSLSETKVSLERELARLRKEHKSSQDIFLEEQAVIRQKLNVISSPTHRLPAETLSIIFLYSLSRPPQPSHSESRQSHSQARDLENIFFSTTLAAVCSLWRSIAFSSPFLWAYFEFPETLWHYKHVPCHLLSLYLHNSKHIPIHLSFSFTDIPNHKTPDYTLFHPSYDRTLIPNLVRTHSLSLKNPPLPWLEQLGKIPFIVDLSVDWPSGIPATKERLQLQRCHALSCLSLRNAVPKNDWRVLYRVPASLTVLDLSYIPMDICIRVMWRCRNLVEAYIHHPKGQRSIEYSLERPDEAWFPQPMIFNHLTILQWPQCQFRCTDAFLRQMRTPKLHTLKLTSIDEELHGIDPIWPGDGVLIEQLPATLKTLEVEEISSLQVDASLGRLFNAQSSVEHLILSKCTWDAISTVFQALPVLEGTSQPKYLPQLRSLSIKNCLTEDDGEPVEELWPEDLELLIESLERRLAPGDHFKVEFSDLGLDWIPAAQIRLEGLLKKGFHLEVIEDGEQLEWL